MTVKTQTVPRPESPRREELLSFALALPSADLNWLAEQLNRLVPSGDDDELPESATFDEAIDLYLADKCSLGRAAELAGVTRWDIMDVLKERGIPTNGDHELTEEEVEWMLDIVEDRYGLRE